MQVSSKVGFSIGLLGSGLIVCSFLLIWATQRIQYNQNQISLAFQCSTQYSNLSTQMQRVYRSVHHDIIDRNEHLTINLDREERSALAKLNAIIAMEEQEDVTGNLMRSNTSGVRDLKKEIVSVFARFQTVSSLLRMKDPQSQSIAIDLASKLDQSNIINLIQKNTATEHFQLFSAIGATTVFDQLIYWIAISIGILALLTTAWIYLTFFKHFRFRLGELAAGADQFSNDQLDHRIKEVGSDEFTMLARQLNTMATRIQSKQQRLKQIQSNLEDQIARRTSSLRQANIELETKDASRRRFFAQIGHELRTPVTAIKGEAEVALRSKRDPERKHKKALETIIKLSDQLTTHVGDLFIIARGEAGFNNFQMHEIDLREIVAEAVDQQKSLFELKSATLRFAAPKGSFMTCGEAQRLNQVVHILLTNAITHCPTGVCVDVVMTQDTETVGFEVRDNGPGIPIDQREKAYELFSDSSGQGQPSMSGTGLGFQVAKSIISGHQGTITIAKLTKGGAEISVTLPRMLRGDL